MGLTAAICEAFAGLDAASVPPEAVAAADRLALDGLAVALAGSLEASPRILAEDAGTSEPGPCALIGSHLRVAPIAAARVNGAAMHVLDYEAMWSPANHATSTTLPAVLACAELTGADGLEVIVALIKGCEMQARLRTASKVYEPRAFGFHPPGLVGPMGAAVAAGHLLGLDAGQLRHALGIAASQCGSLLANVGSMTKSLHCGHAAACGLHAALLAARGFTANPDVIEARHGYAEVVIGELDGTVLMEVGRPFMLVEPGYALKMFPCQYGTHFAITAALALAARIDGPASIRRVKIESPAMDYVDRPAPATGLEGKFSFQYTVALALLDGWVGIDSFTDERRRRPDIEDMLGRVTLYQNQELPAAFETMHVDVVVELSDGRRLHERCTAPAGYMYGARPISQALHLDKVRDCLSTRLSPENAEHVIADARRLSRIGSWHLRALLAALALDGGSSRTGADA